MYYIFNKEGKCIGTCDAEPDFDDLASRWERAIKSEQMFNNPILVDGFIVETLPALKAQQAEMWERIKQKRYENGLGGVYIERLGKWFQTGEEEKTKYLGLDKVINKLNEINWKCADNTFVKLDRTLLDEIFLQMVKTENADHINAEKHRIAMMEAENPLEYDYSTGWAKTYQDFLMEQK